MITVQWKKIEMSLLMGVNSVKEFQHFKVDTEKRLNRKLLKKELEFLQWVFERYLEEEQQGDAQRSL